MEVRGRRVNLNGMVFLRRKQKMFKEEIMSNGGYWGMEGGNDELLINRYKVSVK